ncbi:GGDEF domain-containing protein [Paenibacillus humicola]|uniref:GGDEF domain-containing protein n=1 Tax=Paenibacillus humicola TaxID=3110540 RepID=UPI00237A4A1B|nr:GGDEF domain-containing protein [Paenibacillus humicola]
MKWLSGSNGQIFASACVMTIVVLMLFMAVRLYKSYRRNRTHRMLVIALPIVLLQQTANICLASPELSRLPYLHLGYTLAGPLSFIIINFVFMKLYTQPSIRLKGLPFLLMAFGLAAVAAAQLAWEPDILSRPAGPEGLPLLAVDFYGLVMNFAIMLNLRGIERRFVYSTSLIAYFVFQLSGIAGRYVFHGSVPMLAVLNHLFPVVYYTLLFLLLFDWVLERLLMSFHSSITDGLTGLYTRRYFQRKAEQLLRETNRIAILFCDIDNFKQLNDVQGHHKADGVLKRVAEIVKEETAGIGSAGRFGGEELLGLVALTGGVKPDLIAETIRRRVEKETAVTVSIGVSVSAEGATVEEVVRQADESMYAAKTSGKNRVILHPSVPRSRARQAEKQTARKANV